MKKLLCLLAIMGLLLTNAYAGGEFEFHGCFRAAALADLENDGAHSSFTGTSMTNKETVGRLGAEVDDWFETALSKRWDLEGGTWLKINTRAALNNYQDDSYNAMTGTSIDGGNLRIIEAFVEFGGIIPGHKDAVMWAGQKVYNRFDNNFNYLFVTDFFFSDLSGTGIGVQKLGVGGGKLNLAYVASDATQETWGNSGDILHTLHAGYNIGKWQLEAGLKYYPTNKEKYSGDTELAEFGYDALIGYNLPGFFGASKGNSKVILQAGAGMSSRNLLGATIDTYNAFHLYDTPGGAEGLAAQQDEDDTSVRLILTGDTQIGPVLLYPNLVIQLNNEDNDPDDELYAFAMREVLPMTKHFSLAFETGLEYRHNDDSTDNDGITYKITAAPTWTVNTGEGPSPEIRLLLSYFGGDRERGYTSNNSGFVAGIQCDLWW